MFHADEVGALWTSASLFSLKLEESSREGSLQVKDGCPSWGTAPPVADSEQETKDKEFADSFTKESFTWIRTAPEQVCERHDDN